MLDNKCQGSAEFILLFGGIMVVVLLAIFLYRDYVSDLSGELKSGEVTQFNSELQELSKFFS